MEHNTEKNVNAEVLEAIKSGRVSMKPRWHFVLRALVAAAIGFVSTLLLIYVLSLVVFLVRENGKWFTPWFLIMFLAIGFIALELLLNHYAFSYRRPLIYTVGGIIVVVLLAGYFVGRTTLHGHLRGPLYQRYHHRPPFRGPVPKRTPDVLIIWNSFGHQSPKLFRVIELRQMTQFVDNNIVRM